jgi:acetoin utilization protein AcuB
MTRDVQAILPETTLVEAYLLMQDLRVRHLPVVVEGRLVGIVSDRDFLGWATRQEDGSLRFAKTSVGSIMTLNPVASVQGATIGEMVKLMMSRQIDCLPIVTLENKLVGMVTSTDLMALLQDQRRELPVAFHVHPAVRA